MAGPARAGGAPGGGRGGQLPGALGAADAGTEFEVGLAAGGRGGLVAERGPAGGRGRLRSLRRCPDGERGGGGGLPLAVAEAVREACVAPGPGGGDPVRPGLVRLPLGLAEGETEAAAAVEALGLRVARPGARGGGEGGGGGGGGGGGELLEFARLRGAGESSRRGGDLATAADLFGQAAALLPEASAEVFSDLAECHLELGDAEESLRRANEAVALEPAGRRGHVRRGAALEALQRFEEAAEAYRQALHGAPRTDFDASLELMLQHALRSVGAAAAPPPAEAPGPRWSGGWGSPEPSGGSGDNCEQLNN